MDPMGYVSSEEVYSCFPLYFISGNPLAATLTAREVRPIVGAKPPWRNWRVFYRSSSLESSTKKIWKSHLEG